MLINVADYDAPLDAFAAARSGDRIYFPGRCDYVAPAFGGNGIDVEQCEQGTRFVHGFAVSRGRTLRTRRVLIAMAIR